MAMFKQACGLEYETTGMDEQRQRRAPGCERAKQRFSRASTDLWLEEGKARGVGNGGLEAVRVTESPCTRETPGLEESF